MEELEAKRKKKSVPVIPWMRDAVDISLSDSCLLDSLPFLDPRLKRDLHRMGYNSLFPVQVAVWHETIGPGCFERDLCINSPTGSGKTLAYALPILQALSTRTIKCLRALVVLPTRDLAVQVKEVFAALAPAVGLSVGLAVGQSSIANEISELIKKPTLDADICFGTEDFPQQFRSAVDILVATPGRLMDHINNTKGFTLEHLCYLVVDETDRLLREAYQSWLPTVLKLAYSSNQTPFPCEDGVNLSTFGLLKTIRSFGVERGFRGTPHPRLVKMVLSATLTQDPSKLAQLDLHRPLFLTTGKRRYQLPEQLKSFKMVCKSKLKPLYLLALLRTLQGEKCIVFTSSVESTHRLYTLLNFFEDLQVKIKEYSRLQCQSIRRKSYGMTNYLIWHTHDGFVKRFKELLQKADNESCPMYSVPSELIESFHPMYTAALERLKKSVESGKDKEGKLNIKIDRLNIKCAGAGRKKDKKSRVEEQD
ncbi:DEAD-box ATP-dependent RNA helicase [Handroanthus impetiginosus]|uniref:ATP-dependent RNA helicase n=1 Tax=Handroanthus impetiginosus TaxID=429701 RepID=A0A2G9G2B1_9LAMI|nr:DEAD-box ATP-dependent RNA helicase [Handroanthus impetiginosus]